MSAVGTKQPLNISAQWGEADIRDELIECPLMTHSRHPNGSPNFSGVPPLTQISSYVR